ncbi:MAG TPA: ABC transporter substrate-binding protein, partial [Candidatus Bathyarchaeia archaeon]
MNEKHLKETITPLSIAVLFIATLLSNVSVASAQEIPRDKILWAACQWTPTSFNPLLMDEGQGWDTYIMYEPMFGMNVANGELIKWLGEDIRWVNGTCIEVTLRDGIYWVKMTPDGPVYHRPITSEDVQYSYYLYGAFDESPSYVNPAFNVDHMSSFRTRVGSMSNFEIVNDRVFRVHIKPQYANSSVMWRSVTRSFVIFPKDVWAQVVKNYSNPLSFSNNWIDSAMPAEWKVASGMYLPYYYYAMDSVIITTIMKRNDLWWGIVHPAFGKAPAPAYLGYLNYPWSNCIGALADLEAGNLDWDGHYIPGLDQIMAQHPHLHTYFNYPPYFPDKSAVLLVPNHCKYPLNEPWLHKAIASVIDYDAISVVVSGYLQTPSPLLIPNDDACARQLVNTTIEDKYRIDYDVMLGLEILNQYCINASGTWYTKDGPSEEWLDLYPDHEPYTDALPNEQGVNVPLGPWEIVDVVGWSDVNIMDVVAADALTNSLGIDITAHFLDWDSYINALDTNNFDFANYCMSWGTNGDMYERYTQMFMGDAGVWCHYGDYRNPELESLLNTLETAPPGSQAQQNIAN